jgi:hypothetical protein
MRPVAGEDVVGLAAQQQVERFGEGLADETAADIVEQREAVQPPKAKPPDVSSSGPPGPCMTPSRLTKAAQTSFLIS